jgi:hypothetical protein
MEILKELNRLNNLRYAMIGFSTGTDVASYCFMTTLDDLKNGDILVVNTKNGLSIAYFARYTEDPNAIERATNWVVQKVDIKEYEANVQAYIERNNK